MRSPFLQFPCKKLTENVPAYANFLSSIFDIAFCHYICIICQMYNGLRNQKNFLSQNMHFRQFLV